MTGSLGRQLPERAYADTNLFVALFAGDGHALHDQALGLFRRVADGRLVLIVTPVVVSELTYVAKALFGWSRAVIAERLTSLLSSDGILVPERRVLARTLELFAQHRRLDFAHAYLAAQALEVGPSAVASFDADFDTVSHLHRVTA